MSGIEWQAAERSTTIHLIDTDRPQWRNPDGSRRRSGPRSLCGRYPFRGGRDNWFGLSANSWWPFLRWPNALNVKACPDCYEQGLRS